MNRMIVGAGIATLFVAAATNAAFNPANWTLGTAGDASASLINVGDTLELTGPVAGLGGSGTVDAITMTIVGGNSNIKGTEMFTATALTAGNVTFSWAYSSFDSGAFDTGGFIVNNVLTGIAINSGPFNGNGNFAVGAGESFGFGVRTFDGIFGAGTLVITGFEFTGTFVPAPGAVALLGLAGLVGRRRRS